MTTVALIVLVLILNAVAITLALRYVLREVRITLNTQTRKLRTERRAAAGDRARQDLEIADLRGAFKQAAALMTPEKSKGLSFGPTFRDRMEDRHIADIMNARQVTVSGVPAAPSDN